MRIDFEHITAANQAVAESLRVAPGQESSIEPVSDCLAEARQNPAWNPVLVKVDDQLVGFAMYGLIPEDGISGEVWLDRFMIDSHFQGRGYSRPILVALIERIHKEFGYPELFLSVYDTNRVAVALYEKLGFRFNGGVDINGEKVMTLHQGAPPGA